MANQGDDSRDVNDVTWIQIPETHIMVKEGVRNEEGVRNVYYYATTTEDLMQVADATQTEAQIMEIINASSILQEHKNAMARNVQAKVKLVPAELASCTIGLNGNAISIGRRRSNESWIAQYLCASASSGAKINSR